MEKATKGHSILEDGHVMFVVEVLVETQYTVLTVRNGVHRQCSGINGSIIKVR